MNKKIIAFTCIYSYPSICGVWSRVYNLSKELIKKGYEVHVFSTSIIKGTKNQSQNYEEYEGIKIHRFNPYLELGENIKFWNFKKELKKINPDLIISEVYRHPHTKQALKVAKQLKKPIFLTTHAPFVDKKLRTKLNNIQVLLFDKIFKKYINQFDKIITIAKWEFPYLEKLGVNKEKIVYIPNPIPDEFFNNKITKEKENVKKSKDKNKIMEEPNKQTNILFFGRISPVKNLECLIRAVKILKDNNINIKVDIIGPAEENYLMNIKNLIKELNLEQEIIFKPAVFEIKEKIKTYKEHNIFVLPSWREAMPISLIEAGACGLTLVSSKTLGTLEIIENNKTGYIFEINNEKGLAERIRLAIKKPINCSQELEKYSIKTIAKQLENLYKSL